MGLAWISSWTASTSFKYVKNNKTVLGWCKFFNCKSLKEAKCKHFITTHPKGRVNYNIHMEEEERKKKSDHLLFNKNKNHIILPLFSLPLTPNHFHTVPCWALMRQLEILKPCCWSSCHAFLLCVGWHCQTHHKCVQNFWKLRLPFF